MFAPARETGSKRHARTTLTVWVARLSIFPIRNNCRESEA